MPTATFPAKTATFPAKTATFPAKTATFPAKSVPARGPGKLSLVALVVLFTASLIPICAQPTMRTRLDALRKQLLSNYVKQFGPIQQNGSSIAVNVSFTLVAILDLNAAKQVLSTLSYLVVQWMDPDLVWDPTVPGSPGEDISYIQLSPEDIWIPKLLFINRAQDEQPQLIDHYDAINIRFHGLCEAHLPMKTDTTCQVDVTAYPFDTQVCQVAFGILPGEIVTLRAEVLELPLMKFFDISGEWELRNIVTSSHSFDAFNQTYPFVQYSLILNRRFFFYLLTIIFPIVLLSVTGACGFLLPLQCGEKVSFQVAIMVSLSVFLSFISDAMPKTSSSTSRLALYVDLLLLQSCLAFLATLIVLRGHFYLEKLQQEEKGKECKAWKEPEDQRMRKVAPGDVHPGTTGVPVQSCGQHLRLCLRRLVKRWYCCCCCIPPQHLDNCFFVIFMIMALGAPFVMLI